LIGSDIAWYQQTVQAPFSIKSNVVTSRHKAKV